jgi:outer membrane protein, multidrug efflux system
MRARLERARGLLRQTRSQILPSTNVAGSAQYARQPAVQTFPGIDRENWQVAAGLDLSYEVDLFGRVSRSIEASRGDYQAAQADVEASRVSIVAETTRAYVEAASAAEQIRVAQEIVGLLDRSTKVTQRRFEAGLSQRLDVARQATLAEQRRAEIPPLVAQRQAALYRLALLTGRTPDQLPQPAQARLTTPEITQLIPIGDGVTLLQRRPDVRAAERRLAANTARIGVATADLFPQIRLGGSAGVTSLGFGDLFTGGAFRYLVGPLISWAFPNQEAIRGRITAARADRDGSLAAFDGTVLRALQEADTALSAYQQALQRRATLTVARDEAVRATRIIGARAREGQVDTLTQIDAQRTSAETQAALAQSNFAVANAQVDLFRALGGGWQAPATTPAANASVGGVGDRPAS